jgi:hypothetical protein
LVPVPLDPVVPLLVPPMPGLAGEVVLPVPEELVPVPEELVPVPEELVPVPEVLPVPELPVLLPLRSWRRQSSFAMPVSTSQRLELELAPLEVLGLALGLEVEPVLGLLGLVLGLVVELLPLGLLGLVWAIERLAAPRNAAAMAA